MGTVRSRVGPRNACFCYKQVCLIDNSGKGCAVCEAFIEEDVDVNLSRTTCKWQYQVLFLEEHRFFIALVVKQNKERDKTKAHPLLGTSDSLVYTHIDTALNNVVMLKTQSNNDHSHGQHI